MSVACVGVMMVGVKIIPVRKVELESRRFKPEREALINAWYLFTYFKFYWKLVMA